MPHYGEHWKEEEHQQAAGASSDDTESVDSSIARNERALEQLQTCCKWFIPGVTILVTIVMLILVIVTSGSQQGQGVARAAVIVLEGFKGTAFDQLMQRNKLPNLQLLGVRGQRSACSSLSDARCARTQSGQLFSSDFLWKSGPGLASILTGVDSLTHAVNNDSLAAYSQFTTTSAAYPSFLTIAQRAGLTSAVIGSPHLLTTTVAERTGSCSLLGVLDFECGSDAAARCGQTSSCNAAIRTPTFAKNDWMGTEESALVDKVAASFNAQGDADIFFVHTDKLARLAEDPSLPNAFYSADSLEYTAEAYVLDAVVGSVLSFINTRVEQFKENWLIVLTSDHGGLGKTSGTNQDDDEVVPFIVSTMTSAGYLRLSPLLLPTKQMDVAPTVLRWFGLTSNTTVDGRVQGICADGMSPTHCVAQS